MIGSEQSRDTKVKCLNMNITESIATQRNKALLSGDYDTYHAQTTRRIHALRKRLGVATPRGRKFTPKGPVTAEDVRKNVELVQP